MTTACHPLEGTETHYKAWEEAGWGFHYTALLQGKPWGGEGPCIMPRSRKSPKGQKVGFSGWDEHLGVATSRGQDLGGSTWGWRQCGCWLRLCLQVGK